MPTKDETVVCASSDCDEVFTPRRWNQVYHSQKCKRAMENARRNTSAPSPSKASLAAKKAAETRRRNRESVSEQSRFSPLRILFFDIETAPMLAYIWQAKTEYVNTGMITHDTFLISWSAKWGGEKKVHGEVLTPQEAKDQDDDRIVLALAQMLRDADVVVAHNGDRFDIPMVNNRLLSLGQEPLGPIKTIDTLTLSRKSFRLASNKLDYLARQLGIGAKIETDFGLWKGCYAGDSKALRKMLTYNQQDVVLLEEVYNRISAYVKGLPRLVDANYDGQHVCPFCGGSDLQRRGLYRTNASTFQRYQCQGCARWSRARTAMKSKRIGIVPLA